VGTGKYARPFQGLRIRVPRVRVLCVDVPPEAALRGSRRSPGEAGKIHPAGKEGYADHGRLRVMSGLSEWTAGLPDALDNKITAPAIGAEAVLLH